MNNMNLFTKEEVSHNIMPSKLLNKISEKMTSLPCSTSLSLKKLASVKIKKKKNRNRIAISYEYTQSHVVLAFFDSLTVVMLANIIRWSGAIEIEKFGFVGQGRCTAEVKTF